MLRVIVPPEPFMTPADIPGSHPADDARVAAMIAAVVGQIDGPDGTLGRCIGPQTLQKTVDGFSVSRFALPCPPFIPGTLVVKYLDVDGLRQTLSPAVFGVWNDVFMVRRGAALPSTGCFPGAVVLEWRAGYNGEPVSAEGTGGIPAQIKQAITLMVQHLIALGADNLFLRAEEVEGIGRLEYTVSEQAGTIIKTASDRLLSGLKVRRV